MGHVGSMRSMGSMRPMRIMPLRYCRILLRINDGLTQLQINRRIFCHFLNIEIALRLSYLAQTYDGSSCDGYSR